MELYLHIGTEKTGSSYLQSLLARNREQLENNAIYFPGAGKREKDMHKGSISPGNAQDLFYSLEAERYREAENILTQHYKTAKQKNCSRLLLSNEMLCTVLGREVTLKRLSEICRRIGFEDIRMLLLLRDPVDQALSLYKHRAKGGTAGDIESWIRKEYQYYIYLKSLFEKMGAANIELTCRRYRKKSGYLDRLMFVDWLQIEPSVNPIDKTVNPSLSISELLLIRKLREYNPALVTVLYDQMLKIPKEDKAGEQQIERYYQQVLDNYLCRFEDVWLTCNRWLAEDEQLTIPEGASRDHRLNMEDKVLTFSPSQAESLAKLMDECLTVRMQWYLMKASLKKKLGKLKNKFIEIITV